MFRLHETTHRRLCQLGFVALCILPILGIIAWSAWLRTSHFHTLEERQLSGLVGANVRFAQCRHVRPGVVAYDQVEVSDPETAECLARVLTLEVRRQGGTILLALPEVALYSERALVRLWSTLERQLRQIDSPGKLRIQLASLSLRWPGVEQRFVVPEVQVGSHAIGRYFSARFHQVEKVGETAAAEACALEVWLDRRQKPSQLYYSLKTGAASLPCRLFAPVWPPAARLGGQSLFQGTLWAQEINNQWQGEVAGLLRDIDLDALITEQFPHRLSGRGQARVDAAFDASTLARCSGLLEAGPGEVGASLLASAGDALGAKAAVPSTGEQATGYDRLILSFDLTRGVIQQLQGSPDHGGAIFIAGNQALLTEPPAAAQPIANLVEMLEPAGRHKVAASRRSARLVELLIGPGDEPAQAYQAAEPPPETSTRH